MLKVAAAIIQDQKGQLLLCRRGAGGNCAFLWEFPGGKLEPGETPQQCVLRECQEELGLALALGPLVAHTTYAYPDKEIEFWFFAAHIATGTPQRRVHEALCWALPSQLKEYAFCPADQELVRRLAAQGGPFAGGDAHE